MRFCVLPLFFIFTFLFSAKSAQLQDYISNNKYVSESENKLLYPYIYFIAKAEGFYDKFSPPEREVAEFFYTKSDLLIDLKLNSNFTVHTNFALEKIYGSSFLGSTFHLISGERPFYGTSFLNTEFAGQLDYERSTIRIGKISPSFGAGSERESEFFYEGWYGISGTFINESYKLSEKIGIEINMNILEKEDAKVKFQAAAFTNDNTVLFNKPFISQREIVDFIVPEATSVFPDMPSKRMAGSARNLKSHSVSLHGFIGLNNRDALSFNMGYKNQYADLYYPSERGFALSLQYTRTFFEDFIISVFGEGVSIRNAYSIPTFREQYLTGSISASFSGFKGGYVRNNYRGKLFNKKIAFTEYFIGFEFPNTGLSVFLSKKKYDLPKEVNQDMPGFGINIRFKIK